MKNAGEDIAQGFLQSKGYEILERNFRASQFGEVDIICRDGNEIVFVEVKMRSGGGFGEPEDAVDARKLAKIARVAEVYLGG
ncbi:MAG: YraN family protein, partial [Candidatus Gracilibacteria bacterium]